MKDLFVSATMQAFWPYQKEYQLKIITGIQGNVRIKTGKMREIIETFVSWLGTMEPDGYSLEVRNHVLKMTIHEGEYSLKFVLQPTQGEQE